VLNLTLTVTLYSKTLYFRCILISRFWNVEILLHFNLAFSQCSTSIYLAFDGQTEFSRVFNFAILSYSRNSRKFDAHEKYVFYILCCKFAYADDICFTTQAETFAELECTLTADLTRVTQYCQRWRLKPSTSKIVSSVFHLQNTWANRQLNVSMSGDLLKHDPNPVYLGVTLDRTKGG